MSNTKAHVLQKYLKDIEHSRVHMTQKYAWIHMYLSSDIICSLQLKVFFAYELNSLGST